jgi:hypothetical protein
MIEKGFLKGICMPMIYGFGSYVSIGLMEPSNIVSIIQMIGSQLTDAGFGFTDG